MKRKLFGLFFFLLITAVVIALIKTANWLPLAIQHDTLRTYSSIEAVRASLPIKDLYVPAYFPQTIGWPPSTILAQAKPSIAILMRFNQRGTNDEALVITQTADQSVFARETLLQLTRIAESVPYKLEGRNAQLEVGTCKKEEICSRISWQENEYQLTVVMKAPPFELIRIAASMLR